MLLSFKKIIINIFAVVSLVCVFSISAPVYADVPIPGSPVLCNGDCIVAFKNASKESIVGVIIAVAQYATYVIVALSVLFLVYGAFLFVTDNGSGDSAKKGQKVLVNAIIGLVISILAYTVVSVIGNLLVGTKLTV
jgi:hypothetical protein